MGGTKMNRLWVSATIVLMCSGALGSGKTDDHPAANPLSQINFAVDEDVKCFSYAVETGDPDHGPSTMILKAKPHCAYPWHYHTAQEQLMVVRGEVLTEMENAPAAKLGPGGFAFMLSKQKHKFGCEADEECLMFVTFDRAYDIFWGAPR